MAIKHNLNQQKRRAQRIHARIIATAGRPKLLLTRSNKAIYLQVIDHHGKIITASSEHSLAKATLNVRPMLMASPTLFMEVVSSH